jgi:hypothetical protein
MKNGNQCVELFLSLRQITFHILLGFDAKLWDVK